MSTSEETDVHMSHDETKDMKQVNYLCGVPIVQQILGNLCSNTLIGIAQE